MNKFFSDIITDITGNDYDVAKILWILGIISYIVYAGIHIYLNHIYDPMLYGTGLGAALGGGGFAVQQRNKEQQPAGTVPPKPEDVKIIS
jgi:hypothetical protein